MEFQNYSVDDSELGVLKFELNEREIPKEYKELLKTESEKFREAMDEIDDNFKEKNQKKGFKVSIIILLFFKKGIWR